MYSILVQHNRTWEPAPEARPGSQTPTHIWSVDGPTARRRSDALATEEPLEIRVLVGSARCTVAVTMRTPGADFELAAGFLYAEGVLTERGQIRRISYCVDPDVDPEQRYNVVNVELRGTALPDLGSLDRHFYINSACGVCGKASLAALHVRGCPTVGEGPSVTPELVRSLPAQLRSAQGLFHTTGGLHAAGVFDAHGRLLAVREDVGRHNALDKLIGWALMGGWLPLDQHIVLVSGRASYELLQKCLVAAVPVVCAVSAPSSLAVAIAREFGMTLVGFLRDERFNVYAGFERVHMPPGGIGTGTDGPSPVAGSTAR
ncbi:MAG: formate dehydrogenase accessory sulfurtransferase FdhD [Chloroflexota bacterium]